MNHSSFSAPPSPHAPLDRAVAALYARAVNGSPAAAAEIEDLKRRAASGDQGAVAKARALHDHAEAAVVSGQAWDAACDLYQHLIAGDQQAAARFQAMKGDPRHAAVAGRVSQMQREASIFPHGPGMPRVGAFPMPLEHRPGVGPRSALPRGAAPSWSRSSLNPQPLPPRVMPGGSRRFGSTTFAGQRLTDPQIQELVVMMSLAAGGVGPISSSAPAARAPQGAESAPGTSSPGTNGGGGLGDVLGQIAKARAKAQADANALAIAKQRLFASPVALHTIVSDPTAYGWDFAANAPTAAAAAKLATQQAAQAAQAPFGPDSFAGASPPPLSVRLVTSDYELVGGPEDQTVQRNYPSGGESRTAWMKALLTPGWWGLIAFTDNAQLVWWKLDADSRTWRNPGWNGSVEIDPQAVALSSIYTTGEFRNATTAVPDALHWLATTGSDIAPLVRVA